MTGRRRVDAIRATGARDGDPEHASRPFDATRDGFVMGERPAVLILEEYEPGGGEMAEAITGALTQARLDPAAVDYVNVHGSGTKQNDRHATAAFHRNRDAATDGRQYARAIRQALAQAGVRPDEVDLVMADGAGSVDQDAAEASALREVFGRRGVPVTAPQGLVGRLCAGGSALNVATALPAMRAGVAPPVGNLDDPDLRPGPRPRAARDDDQNGRGRRSRPWRLQQRAGVAARRSGWGRRCGNRRRRVFGKAPISRSW